MERDALLTQLPCLKPEAVAAGMSEPEAADIDVHALHQGYLRGLRQRGGQVLTHAEVTALERQGDGWALRTYVKPFSNWIWLGAMLMAAGGVVSLTDRRYRVGAPARRAARAGAVPAE